MYVNAFSLYNISCIRLNILSGDNDENNIEKKKEFVILVDKKVMDYANFKDTDFHLFLYK